MKKIIFHSCFIGLMIFQLNAQVSEHCPPYAGNDYFNSDKQGFINEINACVFGRNTIWTSQLRKDPIIKSLSDSPAENEGLDYDENNHDLSQMKFELLSTPFSETPQCNPAGNLTWNNDGTFQFIRTNPCASRIMFSYRIIDPSNLPSNIAWVTMDFKEVSPLPVIIKSFTAERNKGLVNLRWTTSSEQNVKGFYVQRDVGEGWINRAFIATAAQDGNSDSDIQYAYTDTNSYPAISQYRLIHLGVNGGFGYSEIKLVTGVQYDDRIRVSVFPNPSNTGTINLLFSKGHIYDLELFDESGRKLQQWSEINSNLFVINGLRPGIYQVWIKDRVTHENTTVRLSVIRK